jgi:hypothetical protein
LSVVFFPYLETFDASGKLPETDNGQLAADNGQAFL